MTLKDLLHPDCVMADLSVSSKKQLFQEMGQCIIDGMPELQGRINVRDIVANTMERERLGSTGVGSGIALPHARMEGIERVYAAFARLNPPLEYDAIDDRGVDLAILLIAPLHASGEHLRALAQVSRRLRREELRGRLRRAPNAESLYVTFMDDKNATAA